MTQASQSGQKSSLPDSKVNKQTNKQNKLADPGENQQTERPVLWVTMGGQGAVANGDVYTKLRT